MRKIGLLVVGVVLVARVGVFAAEVPVAVSPGSPTGTVIGDGCPTFSWDAVPSAAAHELVVYKVGEEGQDAEPVLKQQVPGSAASWTPPLDSCLERGSGYAWSVRATVGEMASGWSAPSLFEVASGPTLAEFEEALALVADYLGARGQVIGSSQATAAQAEPDQRADASRAGTRASGTSRLRVDGRVFATSFDGDGSGLTNVSARSVSANSAVANNDAGRVDAGADAHTIVGSGCDSFPDRGQVLIWQTTEGDIFCYCGCRSNDPSCEDEDVAWICFSD